MKAIGSRRGFLRTALGSAACASAAAGLFAWPRSGRGADKAKSAKKPGSAEKQSSAADKFGGFLVGLQSYSLRNYKVEQALDEIQAMGLGSVELFGAHFPLDSSPERIAEMRDMADARGIRMLGHGVNGFGADHEANRKVFEFAKQAGIPTITADPSPESFESLDKLVAEYDIRIAIHNHGPGARYDKITDVLKAIEGHDDRIGACADLGHYIRSAEDPVKAVTLFEGRLYGIHLKDFAAQKGDAAGVILGKGHLDVAGVFRALRKVKFPADGALSLEYEEKPENPLADIRECLAVASEAALKSA